MNALTFATHTLASLSSAFTPKHAEARHLNLSELTFALDDNAQRSFYEFSTGMKMLYQHGSRNPCNINQIAYQNLKLLHSNLKSNHSFRRGLSAIRENSMANQRWDWLPLVSNSDISAGLIYLPAHQSVTPNQKSASLTMRGNELHAPFPDATEFSKARQLYLSLIGDVNVDLYSDITASNVILKQGEAFTKAHGSSVVKRISASEESCLVLDVQLPVQLPYHYPNHSPLQKLAHSPAV
jgi:hypothetical protein